MNTIQTTAAASYVDAVRDALADLPDDEVAEVVEDVAEHLEQVMAELGGDASEAALEDRLGTPEQYAAELRAAAGFPEGGVRRSRMAAPLGLMRFLVTWLSRAGAAVAALGLVLMFADGPPLTPAYLLGCAVVLGALGEWVLVRRRSGDAASVLRELPDVRRVESWIAALTAKPWGAATVDFVVSLRPAWWLLRAWVATQVLLVALGARLAFPVPRTPIAMVVLAAAAIGSVWLGRQAVRGTLFGWRRLVQVAGNAVLTVLTPAVLVLAGSSDSYLSVWYDEPYYEPDYYGLHHNDGSAILNLFLYDEDGRLLEGVRIYDQDGRPVDNVEVWDWAECLDQGGWYAGGAQGNVFPRPAIVYTESGFSRCVDPADASPFGFTLPGSSAPAGVGPEPAAGDPERLEFEK
ncbi:MAG TPA: hypothetical protein VFZ63_20380 [Jiangellaceae bacterium]